MVELDSILEKASSALESLDFVKEYVLLLSDTRRSMLKIAHGEATVQQEWDEIKARVYVSDGDERYLVAEVPAPTPEKIVSTARRLQGLPASPLFAVLPEPTGRSYDYSDYVIKQYLEDPSIIDLSDELELSYIGDAAGKIEFSYIKNRLITSTGADLQGENTSFTGYIRIFDDKSSGQWSWTSPKFEPALARKAITHAKELASECNRLPKITVDSEKLPVLLGPMVSGHFAVVLARNFSASAILLGESFLDPDSLGKPFGAELFSLMDSPLDKNLPRYTLFDEEGVATYNKYLIHNGIIENILHNSKTASKMKSQTTGNAGLVMPRPFQLLIEPGSSSVEELMAFSRRMVYVTNNWYTRFQNYREGTFSTVARDAVFLVENGEPKGCLGRIRLSGRLPELISNIMGIGRELYRLQWWEIPLPTIAPHVLISDLRISET